MHIQIVYTHSCTCNQDGTTMVRCATWVSLYLEFTFNWVYGTTWKLPKPYTKIKHSNRLQIVHMSINLNKLKAFKTNSTWCLRVWSSTSFIVVIRCFKIYKMVIIMTTWIGCKLPIHSKLILLVLVCGFRSSAFDVDKKLFASIGPSPTIVSVQACCH